MTQRDIAAELDLKPMVADNLSELIQETCVFTKHPALSVIAVSCPSSLFIYLKERKKDPKVGH